MDRPVDSVRGDVFLDRVLGICVFIFALVVFGHVLYNVFAKPEDGTVMHAQRVIMGLMTLVGGFAVSRTTPLAFRLAALMFSLRLMLDLFDLGRFPGNRFVAMALVFDLGMLGYCIFRMRALRLGVFSS